MAKNEVKVNLKVDDNGNLKKTGNKAKQAGKDVQGLSKSTVNADRAMKGISRQSSNSTKNFSKMSQGLTGGLVPAYATLAANLFALGAAFRFLKEAADYKLLLEGQKAYAAVSGVAYKTLTRSIQEATAQQITYADAAQAAAIGTAAGLSADQLTRLGEAAKLASIALGRDVTDAFNRLVRGTTKAEPELLDELGIILRLDTALEKYATRIGKSKEALTQFEKSQAITNDVLEQAEQKFGAIAKIMSPEVNQINIMAKSFDDMTNSLKLFIAGPASALATFFSTHIVAAAGMLLLLAQPILRTIIPSYDEFKVKATASIDMHNSKLKEAQIRAEAFAHSTTKMAATARINYKGLSKQATDLSRATGKGAVGPGGGAGMANLKAGREMTPAQLARMRTSAAKGVGPFKGLHKTILDDWTRTLDKMAMEQAEYHTKSGTMLKKGKLSWDVFYAKVQIAGQKTMSALKSMQIGMMKAVGMAMSALTWASIGYIAYEGIKEGINWLRDYSRETNNAESKVSRLLSTQRDLNKEIKEMMSGAASLRDVKAGFGNYVEQAGRSFTSAAIGDTGGAIIAQRKSLEEQKKGILSFGAQGKGLKRSSKSMDYMGLNDRLDEIIKERGLKDILRTEKKGLGWAAENQVGAVKTDKRTQALDIYNQQVGKYNSQMKDQAELEKNLITRVESMTKEYPFLTDVVARMKDGNFELNDTEVKLIEQYKSAGAAVTKLRDSTDKYNKTVSGYLGLTGNKHLNFLADVKERYTLMLEAVNESTKGTEGHTKAVKEAAAFKPFLDAVEDLTVGQAGRDEQIRQLDILIAQDKNLITGGTKYNAMRERQNRIEQNSIKIKSKLATIAFLGSAEGQKQFEGPKGQEIYRQRVQGLRDEISVIDAATLAFQRQDNVLDQLGNTFVKSFETQMTSALLALMDGTKSFSEAMGSMAKAVIQALLQIMAQMMAMRIMTAMFGMGTMSSSDVTTQQMQGFGPTYGNYNTGLARDGGYFNSAGKAHALPSAAEGAVMQGPKSGYPAILHGKEYVLNEKQMGSMMSGGQTNNTSVVVNVKDGQASSQTNGQSQGAALGKLIAASIEERLVNESRPGGLLARGGDG